MFLPLHMVRSKNCWVVGAPPRGRLETPPGDAWRPSRARVETLKQQQGKPLIKRLLRCSPPFCPGHILQQVLILLKTSRNQPWSKWEIEDLGFSSSRKRGPDREFLLWPVAFSLRSLRFPKDPFYGYANGLHIWILWANQTSYKAFCSCKLKQVTWEM